MQKIIVKKDIFNENGLLIIPKDTCIQLSESMKTRLRNIGVLDEILSEERNNNTTEYIEKEEFKDKIVNFKVNHNLSNNQLLTDSIEIVQNIIFNSRQQNWHLYLHTLINYDEVLYTHALDTALITALIGTKLNYSKETLNELVLGALFHDIGLVLTPINIMNKTDTLSKEEEIIYKNHCKLGCSMLANVIESPIVKSIILQHHERLDGSGYPNQLKGDEISRHAQIVMVANEFESATLYTTSKQTVDPKMCLNEMLENTDKYPEEIVKCLIEIIDLLNPKETYGH